VLPDVRGAPAQMIQLLQNLIANAIRHSDRPVTIKVDAEDLGDEWRISVRDNGPGIAPEHQERIFLPFRRLKADEDCAGLGLATCRKIVASHGGRIWCESQPGRGAAFNFTIPKAQSMPREQPQRIAAPSIVPAQGDAAPRLATVLLVDDLEDHLELTRLVLFDSIGLQCNMMTAGGGEQALDVIRHTIASGEPIDLVLLDINMPRMDGFELMECLREDDALKDLAVVMCTGSTYDKDRKRARSLGAAGYLVKPPSWEHLKPIIERVSGLLFEHGGEGAKLLRVAS
jgi:CheY-like chemotaxis protein